jgi:redox-sensitive bicupin YhaK (pirin superfamily)
MIKLRKSEERGYANHGWLKSYHSFSFANYWDPQHIKWGNLCVINEDYIESGRGFGKHGHNDMEIISYVLSGELAHEDSMGNVKGIPPGDVQRMSAGSGVIHSEFNHAKGQQTHLLQIWIQPNNLDIPPSYEQKTTSVAENKGKLCLIASPIGTSDSVLIHADAKVYAGLFSDGQSDHLDLDPKRKAYIHLIKGKLEVNGIQLAAGDALLLESENQLNIEHGDQAEVLVFDLAA